MLDLGVDFDPLEVEFYPLRANMGFVGADFRLLSLIFRGWA